MNHKRSIILVILAFTTCIGAHAAQFTYGAAVANNLAGLNGQALDATDQVEIGTYLNGTFTTLYSGVSTNLDANGDQTNDPGFFFYSNVAKQNTGTIAGQQLAIKWNHAASNAWAIIYVDITTQGLNDAIKDEWTVKGGDGSGSDANINAIDISDLTTGGPNFSTLLNAATLVNARFSGTNLAGIPSFEIIPEPSTYAALLGLGALVGVVLYRRR